MGVGVGMGLGTASCQVQVSNCRDFGVENHHSPLMLRPALIPHPWRPAVPSEQAPVTATSAFTDNSTIVRIT